MSLRDEVEQFRAHVARKGLFGPTADETYGFLDRLLKLPAPGSLDDARAETLARADDGADCPCCGRLVQRYRPRFRRGSLGARGARIRGGGGSMNWALFFRCPRCPSVSAKWAFLVAGPDDYPACCGRPMLVDARRIVALHLTPPLAAENGATPGNDPGVTDGGAELERLAPSRVAAPSARPGHTNMGLYRGETPALIASTPPAGSPSLTPLTGLPRGVGSPDRPAQATNDPTTFDRAAGRALSTGRVR